MKHLFIALLCMLSLSAGAQSPKMDSSTPEGAILLLEDAYRKKDIEAAVAAKDFLTEARLMLERIRREKNEGPASPDLIPKTAHVLELLFRDYYRTKGFPEASGVVSTFLKTEPYEEGVVVVTEVCTWPDGFSQTLKLLVSKTANGWKVLNLLK